MSYQQEYYLKHRERILKDRALRYASDEQYRSVTLARARISSANRRAVTRSMSDTVAVAGRREKFYRMMELPKHINRSYSVLRQWIRSGIVPNPCYRDEAGKVVFPWSQAELLRYLVSHMDGGLLEVTYPEMKAVLHKLWRTPFRVFVVIKELEGIRNGKRRRIHNNPSGGSGTSKKNLRAQVGQRVSSTRAPHPSESKGATGCGRKVRRKDKGTKA